MNTCAEFYFWSIAYTDGQQWLLTQLVPSSCSPTYVHIGIFGPKCYKQPLAEQSMLREYNKNNLISKY